MDIQTKKLQFIREILALDDEKIIDMLDARLKKEMIKEHKKPSAQDLVGVISEEEAEKMKKVIEENCENIHDEDWK